MLLGPEVPGWRDSDDRVTFKRLIRLLAIGAAKMPAMDPRRGLLAAAEDVAAAKSNEVQDLLAVIGDPETVCDEGGWLPAERRELALALFKSKRGLQVQTPGARMADAQVALESLQHRDERAEVRESLRRGQAHLARWEQAQPNAASRPGIRLGPPTASTI